MTARNRDGLIVRMTLRDERGQAVGEIDAVSLNGLLSLGHDEELRLVRTTIVQLPNSTNGSTAVMRALVRTKRGTFTGTGDANPENVNSEVAVHLIRVAESRAIARALRLAVNIGEVAIEELGAPFARSRREPECSERDERSHPSDGQNGTSSNGRVGGHASARPERFRGRDNRPTEVEEGDRRGMSQEQRKLLYRLAFSLGEGRDSATDRVLSALGVERLELATRPMASKAIDALKAQIAVKRSPGESHQNGAASHGA